MDVTIHMGAHWARSIAYGKESGMQVRIWYDAKENKLVAQLGDDRKSRKSVPWDDFGQFDQANPWNATFTAADALSSPPGAGTLPFVLAPEHRALGERPMAMQDAALRKQHEEVRAADEEVNARAAAQQALENETATTTDGAVYEETADARQELEEAQEDLQDTAMDAEDEGELEEAQEEVEDIAEEVEEVSDRARKRGERTREAVGKRAASGTKRTARR
jgi:hypothetical protein